MKGFLMIERRFTRGQDTFLESFPPDRNLGVVFEDDGETAYFYAVEKDAEGQGIRILDALHIYESAAAPRPVKPSAKRTVSARKTAKAPTSQPPESNLFIIWSRDWQAAALVIDAACHAIFDFSAHGGYSINKFPAPNGIWTKGDRTLTAEKIQQLF